MACNQFRLDLNGEVNTCECGHKKSKHSDDAFAVGGKKKSAFRGGARGAGAPPPAAAPYEAPSSSSSSSHATSGGGGGGDDGDDYSAQIRANIPTASHRHTEIGRPLTEEEIAQQQRKAEKNRFRSTWNANIPEPAKNKYGFQGVPVVASPKVETKVEKVIVKEIQVVEKPVEVIVERKVVVEKKAETKPCVHEACEGENLPGAMYCNTCGKAQKKEPVPHIPTREAKQTQYDQVKGVANTSKMPSLDELRQCCLAEGKETNFQAVNPDAERVRKLAYKFSGGYAYLYLNETEGDSALYLEEKLRFGFNNMQIVGEAEDVDNKTVMVHPGGEDFFVLYRINSKKPYSFKYESSIRTTPVQQ